MPLHEVQDRGAHVMEKNVCEGKFILVEGLDGSGKTSAAKPVAKDLKIAYLKGLGRDDGFGRLAKKFAFTFLFLLESLYLSEFVLKKMLCRGEDVLVDKFFFSAAAHIPDCDKWYNRILIYLCQSLLIKPDVAFYFKVGNKTRLQRLKDGPCNKFHQQLIDDPDWMKARETKLKMAIEQAGLNFYEIDTTMRNIDQTIESLKSRIRPYLRSGRG
jgi:thymidylate kinase